VEGYSDIDMTSISKIALTSLPKGVYCLTETLAPKGYVIFESKTYFRISDDRSVTLTDEAGTEGNSNPSASIKKGVDENNNSVYIITVENTPGASLPNAGGPGTNLIYLFGIMLTGLAGTGLVMKRRRRNVA
jgi:LPXTG-motif cell wall-anchored protein